jgi:hypothetical protein
MGFQVVVPAESLHARNAVPWPALAKPGAQRGFFVCLLARRIIPALGGHAARVADAGGRHVLLPLFGLSRPSHVREDLRNAKVCFATVGYELRQAAYAAAS